MKDRLYIIAGFAGFLFLVAGAIAVAWFSDLGEWRRDGSVKVYRRTVAENLRVTRRGVYGVDFVKCGSCRIEKRKRGPLTFAGLNVLVMDDLSIVLPPREERDDEREATGDSPRDLARRLGVSDGFLSGRGMPLKFSGLRITGLTVNRLADGNKPELLFSAKTAEAVRGGLTLHGCTVAQPSGKTESVGKAMLIRSKKSLRLTWSGGEMDLT